MSNEPEVKILPEHLANRIAAGEVVERPASIVKELVENSLDAGASRISVAITRGGKDLISVVDNGIGMSESNLLRAIQRFGTSKISRPEDLEEIGTFGFRGEAIPAICSVSRVTFTTRRIGSDHGTELAVEAGEIKRTSFGPYESGTKVEVRALFFNAPARLKFLKSDSSETSAIKTVVTDFALSNPGVYFTLTVDGKWVNLGRTSDDLVKRAKELGLGGNSYFEVSASKITGLGNLELHGLLSQPVAAVSTASKIRLFVNKRAVRDRVLLGAVKQAFGNYLRPGEFPQGVLALSVPPGEVDVNVHPQKLEVKFRRSELIFHFVSSALKEGLGERASADVIRFHREMGNSLNSAPQENFSFTRYVSNGAPIWYDSPIIPVDPPVVRSGNEIEYNQLRFLSQIFKCYLLFEAGEDLLLLDMHAAHERVYFWRLAAQLEANEAPAQLLLAPEVFELPVETIDRMVISSSQLERFGLGIDRISPNQIAVRSIPALLSGISSHEIIAAIATAMEQEKLPDGGLIELLHSTLTRVACHYSIRSGRELEKEEAFALVDSLHKADASGLCPHGRPVLRYISRYELEKLFGRVGF